MSDKIFVGSGRIYGQYGQIGISVCLDDIPSEHITTSKNGKRYVRLNICNKRNPEPGGDTKYVEVNTWRPDNQG